jgi:hypothetical protein
MMEICSELRKETALWLLTRVLFLFVIQWGVGTMYQISTNISTERHWYTRVYPKVSGLAAWSKNCK